MLNDNQTDAIVKQLFDDIEFTLEPSGLYDPLRYMIQIGGKRVRPKLCITTYSFFSDDFNEGILAPASALEVFHSFTLIHDDIMDRSPLRRGVPTVWKKWNSDTAILSGDVMLIDAYKRIAKAPASVLDKVMDLFSNTAAQVCDGQQYDMDFELEDYVDMERYKQMIGLKTAVLLACSAEMGAIIGGASPKQCEALYNYGYQLGMAFQVADDYLDAFGDVKVFGKPIGGDILNCKKSWLTVRAMEKTDDPQTFLTAYGMPVSTREEQDRKIDTVKQIYTAFEVDKDAKKEVIRYSHLAMDSVADAGFDDMRLAVLQKFADRLVGRAK